MSGVKMREAADAVVLLGQGDQMKVLLIKRKNPPYEGFWALPGGFVEEYEAPIIACMRELFEETGLVLTEYSAISLATRIKKGRDPRGPVMSSPFLFWMPSIAREDLKMVKGGDDAMRAEFVPLLDVQELAFDHGAILCEALGRFWQSMPTRETKLMDAKLPALFSHKKTEGKYLFFGGSFNPWHKGHGSCIELVENDPNIQDYSITVVPDSSPWKEGQVPLERCHYKSYLTLAKHFEESSISVFPGFWGAEIMNPTCFWFTLVVASRKGLILGDDAFLSIKKWKNFDFLLNNLNLICVAPRNKTKEEIQKFFEEEIQKEEKGYAFDLVILPEHKHQSCSSTAIRNELEK